MKNKLIILMILLILVILESMVVHDWIGATIIFVALYYNIMAYRAYMKG